MRIWEIALLPLFALPVALAHDMQAGHAVARHSEEEHMKRQGGVLGGILGGDDDTTSSAAVTSARSTSAAPSAGSTSAPPSSAASTTPPPSASGTSTGSVSGTSGTGSLTGSLSSNSSSTASASNSSSIPIPSTSAAPSMSTSVDAQGQTIIVTQFYTPSIASAASSAAAQTSAPPESAPALSTGAIIGISVAAGVLVLSLIGCAIWRMKRRSGDEDEAIRWPELNRHGDSDAHHALPARQTGQHGIETSPLERSLSNSSSIYHSSLARGPSTHMASTAMALNGSNFGAANSLDYYDEKAYSGGYDNYDNYAVSSHPHHTQEDAYGGAAMVDDYSSMPPPMQHAHSGHGSRMPGYGSDEDEIAPGGGAAGVGARNGSYH